MRRVPENRTWPNQIFYVTISTLGRKSLFTKQETAGCILESLRFFRQRNEVDLFAYVIMPDHVHLILRPIHPLNISACVRRFKSYTTHVLGPGPIWQTGFWSEVIEGHLAPQKMRYVHENPVRAGLCVEPESFPWSSAKEYLQGTFDLVTAP